MRTIVIILILAFGCTLSLTAQKEREMTKSKFTLELTYTRHKTFKVLSFTSAEGRSYKCELTETAALSELRLPAGAVLTGTFQFETFASEGGLGTTRVAHGKGKGKFNITGAVDAKGIKLGCPPLCDRVIDLGLAF